MPIYEYRCADCGTKFEKLVRNAGEAAVLECPSCGQKRLDQQLSTFSAHAGGSARNDAPMCPSGGACPTPGACGLN
ncbi:MAG: zinc ribbon domain-containing protein [Bryobacterales bacterium]|nr:zinc ribbon domain-containing protein [Bryobacterales bacterium]